MVIMLSAISYPIQINGTNEKIIWTLNVYDSLQGNQWSFLSTNLSLVLKKYLFYWTGSYLKILLFWVLLQHQCSPFAPYHLVFCDNCCKVAASFKIQETLHKNIYRLNDSFSQANSGALNNTFQGALNTRLGSFFKDQLFSTYRKFSAKLVFLTP